MKRVFLIYVALFFIGSVIWMSFHGLWECAYVTLVGNDKHSYIIDLNSSPLWAKPIAPLFVDFSKHFSGDFGPLPEGGEIVVRLKWDWWLIELMMIWLLGSLVITPICLICFRRDRALGALARVGAGLIGGALTTILLWLIFGGWGPPSPLVFAILGLLAGGIWATVFASRKSTANKSWRTNRP